MYRVLEYEVKRNTKLEGEGSVPLEGPNLSQAPLPLSLCPEPDVIACPH